MCDENKKEEYNKHYHCSFCKYEEINYLIKFETTSNTDYLCKSCWVEETDVLQDALPVDKYSIIENESSGLFIVKSK